MVFIKFDSLPQSSFGDHRMSFKGTAVIKGYFIVTPALWVQVKPAALRLPHSICGCSPAFLETFTAAAVVAAAAAAVSFLCGFSDTFFFYFLTSLRGVCMKKRNFVHFETSFLTNWESLTDFNTLGTLNQTQSGQSIVVEVCMCVIVWDLSACNRCIMCSITWECGHLFTSGPAHYVNVGFN